MGSLGVWGLVVLGGIFITIVSSVASLRENEKYMSANRWHKSLLAFVLGFLTMVVFPGALYALSAFSNNIYGESIVTMIAVYFSAIAGNAMCVGAGVTVYYRICNDSICGRNVGFILCATGSVCCLISAYYQIGNIISFLSWGAAPVVGVLAILKEQKRLTVSQPQRETL